MAVNPAHFDEDIANDAWEIHMNALEDELGTGMEHIMEENGVGYTNLGDLDPPVSANLFTAALLKPNPAPKIQDDVFEVYAVPADITVKRWQSNLKVSFPVEVFGNLHWTRDHGI